MGDVPTRSRIEIDLLYPRMAESGEVAFWRYVMPLVFWWSWRRMQVTVWAHRSRRSWAYATHRQQPSGRHAIQKDRARHVRRTSLPRQMGWTRPIIDAHMVAPQAPKTPWEEFMAALESVDEDTSRPVESMA